jgi:hypothetical protein
MREYCDICAGEVVEGQVTSEGALCSVCLGRIRQGLSKEEAGAEWRRCEMEVWRQIARVQRLLQGENGGVL